MSSTTSSKRGVLRRRGGRRPRAGLGAVRGRRGRGRTRRRGRARRIARVGRALRPRRLSAGRGRLPTHPSGPRDPEGLLFGSIRIRPRRRADEVPVPAGRGTRTRATRSRDGAPRRKPRSSACSCCRVGREADDPLPGSADERGRSRGCSGPPCCSRSTLRLRGRAGGSSSTSSSERDRARLLRPGRELPAGARRTLRLTDPARHLPPRAGRGEHGGSVGKLRGDRASASSRVGRVRPRRRSACTPPARTRRRCSSSSARSRARFGDARPGRSSTTRGSSGGSRRLRGRSTRRSVSGAPRRGDLALRVRAARPGRARATRGRARGGGRRHRCAAGPGAARRAERGGARTHARAARRRGAPAGRRRRRWLDGGDEPRRPRLLRGERAARCVRVSLPGLRRQPLVELCRRPRRRDGRADQGACTTWTSCSRSAAGSARSRPSAVHAARAPSTWPCSCTCIPTRPSSAPSTRPTSARGHAPRVRGRCGAPARGAALARVDGVAAPARRGDPRARADGGARRPRRGDGVPPGPTCPATRSRPAAPGTSPCGRSLCRVLAVRHAGVPAGAGRWGTGSLRPWPPSSSSGPRRAVLHGGRRLRHELARARDGGDEQPILVLLENNGMYATIRMHQERQFPGRVVGTDLADTDFVELARAYRAHGERVERTESSRKRSSAPLRPAGRP